MYLCVIQTVTESIDCENADSAQDCKIKFRLLNLGNMYRKSGASRGFVFTWDVNLFSYLRPS